MKRLLALLGVLTVATAVFAAEKPALDVRNFGAKGDGVTKDTAALQKALDACATAGGGSVLVSDGTFLTGSLVLGANTTLEIAASTKNGAFSATSSQTRLSLNRSRGQ